MSGPLRLCEEEVASLEVRPGAYVLGWSGNGASQGLYVGRSDADLRGRLRQHLPGKEISIRLQIFAPDCFWFHYTATAEEAFRIECQLYHAHNYLGNLAHPDRGPYLAWHCPVCEHRPSAAERRDEDGGRRAVA